MNKKQREQPGVPEVVLFVDQLARHAGVTGVVETWSTDTNRLDLSVGDDDRNDSVDGKE